MCLNVKLNENFFYTNIDVNDSKELLEIMGNNLIKEGYVKNEYTASVIERENIYPTGLPAERISIAIPHTDNELVNTTTISVATLKKPVSFQNMSEPEDSIKVNIVFMLAIKESKGQLKMLQKIMEIIQDADFKEQILNVQDKSELLKLIENRLGGD